MLAMRTKVKVRAEAKYNKQYTEAGQYNRKESASGIIIDYSNGHGICYAVLHDGDGTVGWYEPCEIFPEVLTTFFPSEKYRHYKGGEYEIIVEGTDVDSKESVVIYRSMSDGKTWVRKKVEFMGTVEVTKTVVAPRFERIV